MRSLQRILTTALMLPVLGIIAVIAITPSTRASNIADPGFVAPTAWTRPTDDTQATTDHTTYQQWGNYNADNSNDTDSPHTPDIASINPTGDATAWDSDAGDGSFFVGDDIYSFSAPISIAVSVPNDAGVLTGSTYTTLILQLHTVGSELDNTSVLLTYNDGIADQAVDWTDSTELSRSTEAAPGGFGESADVIHWFEFQVQDVTGPISLAFTGASSSMALQNMAIDTITSTTGFVVEPTPTPEPASLALLGLGGAAMLLKRRVRT